MSLGIVIKGPEGLVLAAESRLTLTARQPDGGTVHASFDNATKVFGFARPNTAVGVVTYGLGGIGLRSAYSFVPEFEQELQTAEGSKSKLEVGCFAKRLGDFYAARWKEAMPEDFRGPGMTLVVAGFNEGEAYGRVYVIEIPNAAEPQERNSQPGEFGITWGGQREMVDRLLRGYDQRVLRHAQEALSLPESDLARLTAALEPLQMQIPLPAMPLQDCVDLAIFFVKTTVDALRFTVAVRGCGGPVDVATITRERGMRVVQRKEIRGEAASASGGAPWSLGG